MKADPADMGPEATPEGASVLADRRVQKPSFKPGFLAMLLIPVPATLPQIYCVPEGPEQRSRGF
jgi:hypothetical protein